MKTHGEHGYAMVALLVGLSIMSVLMTAVMPTWRQAVQREKEAELVFRGQQYARAVGLFQKKSGPGVLPPNLDVLVEQRFLRRKYKDPITGGDFDLLSAVQAGAGSATPGGTPGGTPATRTPATSGALAVPTPQQGQGRGGIMGVASKSKAASIRIYNGRTHYNEWQFLYVAQTQAPGGAANPGGRGQPQRGDQGQTPPSGFPGTGRGRPPNGGPGRGQPPPPGLGR